MVAQALIDLKNIFSAQLPKMGKEYIARLVLDRKHISLICRFQGLVVGGVTYRPHPTQAFAEIAFCAVSASHQVRGYGQRIMNQLKELAKREGIENLLTYADNHAIGYFRKQGFHKQARGRLDPLAAAPVSCASPPDAHAPPLSHTLPEAAPDLPWLRAGDDEARAVARLHQGLRRRHADGVLHRPAYRLPEHEARGGGAAAGNHAGAVAGGRLRRQGGRGGGWVGSS